MSNLVKNLLIALLFVFLILCFIMEERESFLILWILCWYLILRFEINKIKDKYNDVIRALENQSHLNFKHQLEITKRVNEIHKQYSKLYEAIDEEDYKDIEED